MWLHLARLLPYAALLLVTVAEGNEEKWSIQCPTACSCHLSHFKDLPMRRWLTEESTGHESNPKQSYEYNNEAMYTEDTTKSSYKNDVDDIMKMAICIFQKDYSPEEFLSSLPSNLEVLTILQSPDSDYITLGANAFQNLPDLVALEIQGFHKSGVVQVSGHHSNRVLAHLLLTDDVTTEEQNLEPQDRITILNDALQPLVSLQYLNLQYVKLQGGGRKFHDGSRPMPLKTASYKYDLEEDNLRLDIPSQEEHILHKLVFLAPDPEREVLPYINYHEQLEQSGIYMFSGMQNLVFLRIYGCGLKQVNWEMFDGLTRLEYLSLENNELKFIPEFTFYGTPNLKIISLAYNKLLSLQSTSLAGLLELKKLDLSHNNFSHLSELSLPPFPHLKTADFRHNPIETVFSSTFEIMNATEILYLGGDESEIEIGPKSFSGLDALLKLLVQNVRIQNFERSTLIGMPKLKELEMQGSIESIDFDAFLEVPKLEKLTLQNCQLKTISMDAFYGVYNLLYLDLSNNLLETLPPGLFDQQFALKELLLQNNKFEELPDDMFKQVPAKMIRLEGNPWHCTCSMMSWRETAINKVKQRIAPVCQFQYDKGSSCQQVAYRYVYEKRVAPQCETPAKYKNWSVFYVLRKVLRCKKINWKGGEMKQTKYFTKGEEYLKSKRRNSTFEEKQENKNSTLLTNDTNSSVSSIDAFKYEKSENNQLNSTYNGDQVRNRTEDNVERSKDEGKVSTAQHKKIDRKEDKILPMTAFATSPSYPGEKKLTTPGEMLPTSLSNNNNTGVKNSSLGINEAKVEAQDNLRSYASAKTQLEQKIVKTDKWEGKNDSKKEIKMENQEKNELNSLLLTQKDTEELNGGSLNKKFITNTDNNNLFVSENSNKFKTDVNAKNSYQPAQTIKTSEPEYIIFDGKKNIKVSKKAFKLEMERQKREKLKSQ